MRPRRKGMIIRRGRQPVPLSLRIKRQLIAPDENGCRLWRGHVSRNGQFSVHVGLGMPKIDARRAWFEIETGVELGPHRLFRCPTEYRCCTPGHQRTLAVRKRAA